MSLWSRFVSPIYYRILQNLLKSTPKLIHNIDLKFDVKIKRNLRNRNSYSGYSNFILSEVLRLRDRGYTYKEIANNLNDRGIRSRRNKFFYKNLLVNNMMKYRDKIRREGIKTYTIENIEVDINK